MTTPAPRLSDRNFGFMFAAVFAILAGIVRLAWGHVPAWAVGLAIAFLTIALARPVLLLPLNRLWHRMAQGLVKVTNFILLGLFFLLFFVPVGLFFLIFGNDPIQRSFDRRRKSYWTPVDRQADAQTFRDQF